MPDLAEKLRFLRRELREEYLQPHSWPWMIGFSGGKDSTLILHLVIECLKNIPPAERRRPVFLVRNDTLVESPVYHAFVCRMLERIEEGVSALNVPVQVVRTAPLPEESFWVPSWPRLPGPQSQLPLVYGPHENPGQSFGFGYSK